MAGEITGNLGANVVKDSHINTGANIAKTKFAERSLASFPIKITDWRKWDDLSLPLTNTSATTYLAVATGTFSSDPPTLQTGNVASAGAVTRRARTVIMLPTLYESAESVSIRVNAGMKTTVAGVAANVGVEVYQLYSDGTLSGNLVSNTSNQSCNSLTTADKDFSLDTTNFTPGCLIDVRVTMNVNDAATTNAVIGKIQEVILRADVRP